MTHRSHTQRITEFMNNIVRDVQALRIMIEEGCRSDFDDVGDFHEKFMLDNVTHHGAEPREITPELIEFRLKFLLEELVEFGNACGYSITMTARVGDVLRPTFVSHHELWGMEQPKVDHVKAFDALLDLNYVSHGTAHLFGYPWAEGWLEVQRANMTKERCVRVEDSTRGSTLDVIKPPGWTPPDIQGVLIKHGWWPNETNVAPLGRFEELCAETTVRCPALRVKGSMYCAVHEKQHARLVANSPEP